MTGGAAIMTGFVLLASVMGFPKMNPAVMLASRMAVPIVECVYVQ